MKLALTLALGLGFVATPALAGDDVKTLYATYCSACHGDSGKGDGVAGKALDPKPSDLTATTMTDEELAKIIKDGGPALDRSPLMAPWGSVLDDAKVKEMVAFIKTLGT